MFKGRPAENPPGAPPFFAWPRRRSHADRAWKRLSGNRCTSAKQTGRFAELATVAADHDVLLRVRRNLLWSCLEQPEFAQHGDEFRTLGLKV
jgi:hypothetical protein